MDVIFSNPNGLITDLGEEITVSFSKTDEITVYRYGVWQHNSKGKPQVTFTSNDLDECKALLVE